MKRALERQKAGEALVVPIILRPTDWKGTPFSTLQALPRDGRPVSTWPNRDQAFTEIVQELHRIIEELDTNKSTVSYDDEN